jgi:hypothetical protein
LVGGCGNCEQEEERDEEWDFELGEQGRSIAGDKLDWEISRIRTSQRL